MEQINVGATCTRNQFAGPSEGLKIREVFRIFFWGGWGQSIIEVSFIEQVFLLSFQPTKSGGRSPPPFPRFRRPWFAQQYATVVCTHIALHKATLFRIPLGNDLHAECYFKLSKYAHYYSYHDSALRNFIIYSMKKNYYINFSRIYWISCTNLRPISFLWKYFVCFSDGFTSKLFCLFSFLDGVWFWSFACCKLFAEGSLQKIHGYADYR